VEIAQAPASLGTNGRCFDRNGAVGAKQVNSSQVQLRVSSACSSGAIASVGLSGTVTCTPTVGSEYGSNTAATTLGTGATQVATQSLAAGSSTAGQPDHHDQEPCGRSRLDPPDGRNDPARAAGGVLDERPAGDRELHRSIAADAGADGGGRHHDQAIQTAGNN